MTRFSGTGKRPVRANLTAAVRTTPRRVATYEGGAAYKRDEESDLFLLAATNMVGEDTFYERAIDRDARFLNLVHRVTVSHPEFIAGEGDEKIGFCQHLRQHMGMRSATVVMAAEYVAAGGADGRSVIARAPPSPTTSTRSGTGGW